VVIAITLTASAVPKRTFRDKSSLVQCLTEHERPVWAKEEPATLDLYDNFAAQRAELARR
jgi:hypothetical protein